MLLLTGTKRSHLINVLFMCLFVALLFILTISITEELWTLHCPHSAQQLYISHVGYDLCLYALAPTMKDEVIHGKVVSSVRSGGLSTVQLCQSPPVSP